MKKKKLVHTRTTVNNIGYHIVWTVKYRRPVLTGEIELAFKELVYKIAADKGFVIEQLECDKDHVHVFASAHPKISPSYIYKMLKGISAWHLFNDFPELRNKLYNKHLWNPSTYIETVGHVSEETVKMYIQNQKKK